MKVYTKTGDKGTTSLATGERVSKSDLRLAAYGTADELNSFIGLLRSKVQDLQEIDLFLDYIQNKMFNLGAELAGCEGVGITAEDVLRMEETIDMYSADLPVVHAFILPGGNERISLCHVCRTITRRLEREMVVLKERVEMTKNNEIGENSMIFVNRLSDFFFILAKKIAKNDKCEHFLWKK